MNSHPGYEELAGKVSELEKLLEDSEARYRFLAERTTDLIWTTDVDFRANYISPAVSRILGFTPQELLNGDIRDLMTPESFHRVSTFIEEELAKEAAGIVEPDRFVRVDAELLHRDGHTVWLEGAVQALRGADGSIIGFYGESRDITERKQAEIDRKRAIEELSRSEKRLAMLVSRTPAIIYTFQADEDNIPFITYVSDNISNVLGFRPEDFIGNFQFWESCLHPDDRHIVTDNFHDGERHMEYRFRDRRGSYRWLCDQQRVLEDDKGGWEVIGAWWDITGRKNMEQALLKAREELETLAAERTRELVQEKALLLKEIEMHNRTSAELRESEERFRSIYEHIGVGISVISPEMEILALNPQMNQWFPEIDVDSRPVCFKSFNDPPGKEPCPGCPALHTLRDGKNRESIIRTPRKSGARFFRITTSPLKDRDGKVEAVIEMVMDITDNITTQKKLEESEALYQAVFENTGTAMIIADDSTNIIFANEEFQKLSNLSRNDLEGRMSARDFIAKEDLRRMKDERDRLHLDPMKPATYECRAVNASGKVLDIVLSVAAIPGTSMYVVSFIDISESKQYTDMLQQREKELAEESRRLGEMNTALKVLLDQRESDRREVEKTVLSNVRKLVIPYMEKLDLTLNGPTQKVYASIAMANLEEIVSPFVRNLEMLGSELTSREIEVATLVREGKTAKEIAELLNLSTRSVEGHKISIRYKLGLRGKKANLRSHLLSLMK